MPVTEFIPVKDAKITIEKEVKPKRTLKELTTIEVPGTRSKKDELEEASPKEKKRTRAKKQTSEPESVRSPKKDAIFIITEKPQAAQKIAAALGSPSKKTEGSVSYYEVEHDNQKILVASAVGHLFGLNYKAGQKGWPIFELEWRPSYEKEKAGYTKKYYDVLKKLSRRAKELIVATDYDIEGEVIGWNVVRFICNQTTAKRMKYSTLTKPELVKSYENLMPEIDWGQAYAGESRHILDWLYGINLSRALMSAIKTTGSFKLLSIGRVQGPALKIIVEREREILEFKPEPYWQIFADVDGFSLKHPEDIFDKNLLPKFDNITEGNATTEEKEERVEPPHPFDLTTLQREAYRVHGLSPSQTLSTAQKLYLDGLISYPRTSSQKIPESIEPKRILKALEKHYPDARNAKRSVPIEGKKSDPAHPSIYPTGEYDDLKGAEQKLYDLIVRRFIAAFSADAQTIAKRVTLAAANDPSITFKASGLKIQEKGWTSFYPATLEEKSIPTLNGHTNIDAITKEEKETQPPKRYTPTSLITLLEKKNLGTKTTRSLIIDTLFDRGYLDGKSIQATPLGMQLIASLEKYSPIIIDENLTRQLEEEMDGILEAKSDFQIKEQALLDKTKRLITDIAKEFKAQEAQIGKDILQGVEKHREQVNQSNTLMQCPKCKQGMLRILYSKKTRRSFVACSAYPNCTQTFSLPPNSLIKKSEKNCEADGFPKLLAIRKGKRPWEFCFNPECPIEKKKREEWAAKKEKRAGNEENSEE